MFSDPQNNLSRLPLHYMLSVLDGLSADAERHHSFPDAKLLWMGCAAYGGSVDEDAREFLNILDAENVDAHANFRRVLKTFINAQSRQTALALVSAADRANDRNILMRAQFYALLRGAASVAYDVHETEFSGYTGALLTAYRHGAVQTAWIRSVREPNAFTQREVIHTGIRMLVEDLVPIGELSEALHRLENEVRPVAKSAEQLELEATVLKGVEEADAKQSRLDDLEILRQARISHKARSTEDLTDTDIAAMNGAKRSRDQLISHLVAKGITLENAIDEVDRPKTWSHEDLAAMNREQFRNRDLIVPDPTPAEILEFESVDHFANNPSIDPEELQLQIDMEIEAELAEQEAEEADEILNSKRVLGSVDESGDRDRKAFIKGFSSLSNARTLMLRYEQPSMIAALREAWPHAVDIIDMMARDLVQGRYINLKPTLLVGAPGSGKTTLLREFVDALMLPRIVFPCASVADGSFGGTPAQWSTRRASVPLELIRTNLVANPAIILDELEKTGISGHNGSLVHALLPLLEKHSAESYFETALETDADLSGVNFLATSNSLDIPDPVRDRFRIIQMPDPGPEHIGVLSRRIIAGIAQDRSINEAWIPALDPDEIDVIKHTWKGGSLRKLRVAVEATIDTRDRMMSVN